MRIADLVAQTLANFGAKRAFGMPGGEVLTVIDALNAAGVKFVLARNENWAAIMAAGASVASDHAPGVLVTTLGPGLANAVNGIADASQEHVPLIVIAGVVDHNVRHRYTHQVIDHSAVLRPLVKGCFEVETAGAAATVARAVTIAMSAPMGPVLIEIAPGTAKETAGESEQPRQPPSLVRPTLASGDTSLADLRAQLHKAVRPLLIAGWDAARTGAAGALTKLAEQRAIPVITTYKAKGVIPESHALALGAAGLSPLADKHLLPLVKAADTIILAGYDPIEMRQGWLDPFDKNAQIIEIAEKTPDHGMHHTTVSVEGNIAEILRELTPQSADKNKSWPKGEPQAVKQAITEAFAPTDSWGPHAVIASLEKRLTPETTVTVDSGAHRILLSQLLKIERPLGLLQSAGFCTMGPALPLAAGVKSILPQERAIAVLGDGGMEMVLGELATLRDEALPIVLIVFQDESLALIELKQRQSKLSDAGVRLGPPAFEDIAPACGGNGVRVTSLPEFEQALDTALGAATFTLIVCTTKASDYDNRI